MSAADKLAGLTLENGWHVTRHLARNPNGTGGTFSQSYEVRRDDRLGFLKAFDFSRAFDPGVDTLTELPKFVGDYTHEREILRHCSERKLSNVVIAVDHGEIQIQGMRPAEGRVYYLIFEMAQCDIRVQMDLSKRLDTLQCMIALKDVTLGLHQVHKELIAHQDTKPSNVLVYGDKSFKIADFGRSSKRGQPTRHDTFIVAGDRTYAPPELLYDYTHPEFVPRRIGCDMYMLGNLAGFFFSGTNITASLLAALDPEHHPRRWGGTYREIIPYLQRAFTLVLADIAPLIDEMVRDDVLNILREQCNPDLDKRGHPKRLGRADQYSLERHVSHLELVAKRLAISRRIAGLKAA